MAVRLQRAKYDELNAKQKEIYNFQKVAGLLAEYGYNCLKLSDDWQGADFLAYHKDGTQTLKVQLKARLTINRSYLCKGLYMTFPVRGKWYLILHDELVAIVGEVTNWLHTKSWETKGIYSSPKPSKELLARLADCAI